MQVPIDRARATLNVARSLFTEPEIWRLLFLEATVAAERRLLPIGLPCPDRAACRRLAFDLWLRLTGRVSDSVDA
jgi:hypothetical protein